MKLQPLACVIVGSIAIIYLSVLAARPDIAGSQEHLRGGGGEEGPKKSQRKGNHHETLGDANRHRVLARDLRGVPTIVTGNLSTLGIDMTSASDE
jgi:hypothetical protein